ncbi:MAG: molybdenum cofactor biosynthesis protein MoaE [Ignavibacteria bacterium]
MVSITTDPIDVASIYQAVQSVHAGGIVLFAGTVRNRSQGRRVNALEYSAYIPMAEKLMAAIEEQMRAQWPLHHVVLVHRVGMLALGEVAIVTAVAAAHRKEAFEACRFGIDRIKAEVPIWKKEHFEDGQEWVVGRDDADTPMT